jgi:prevent-host-death family protein
MTDVGIFEAKSQLSSLIERAEGGEEITITKHGKPVARLVGVSASSPDRVASILRRMSELRKGATLGELTIRALRDEGRS